MLLSQILFTQPMHRGLCRVGFWDFLYRNVFSLSILMSGARRWGLNPMHLIGASSDIGGSDSGNAFLSFDTIICIWLSFQSLA